MCGLFAYGTQNGKRIKRWQWQWWQGRGGVPSVDLVSWHQVWHILCCLWHLLPSIIICINSLWHHYSVSNVDTNFRFSSLYLHRIPLLTLHWTRGMVQCLVECKYNCLTQWGSWLCALSCVMPVFVTSVRFICFESIYLCSHADPAIK